MRVRSESGHFRPPFGLALLASEARMRHPMAVDVVVVTDLEPVYADEHAADLIAIADLTRYLAPPLVMTSTPHPTQLAGHCHRHRRWNTRP